MNNRYCVIMGGGVGSRFWPYSRKNMPKQFIDFLGTGRTLLQMSFDRVKGIVPASNIIVVTNKDYRDLVLEQLPELDETQILLEPARRNTAPCIAWAAFHIHALNPDASIMVSPSDHLIFNEDIFRRDIINGFEFIESHDALLTLGIKPNRPETGYGYIQIGEKSDAEGISQVKTFTENQLIRETVIDQLKNEYNIQLTKEECDQIYNYYVLSARRYPTLEIAEDYEFWLRWTDRFPVVYCDEPLIVKRAGNWPQLSTRYGQIEIFRLRALLLLLKKRMLSEEHCFQAAEEAARKAEVYALGCRKRGRTDEALEWERIAGNLKRSDG